MNAFVKFNRGLDVRAFPENEWRSGWVEIPGERRSSSFSCPYKDALGPPPEGVDWFLSGYREENAVSPTGSRKGTRHTDWA